MGAGIYIHIPFCKQKCGYCSFISSCDYSSEDIYFAALKKEIALRQYKKTFDTVYFGGGTPSSVNPQNIVQIIELLKEAYHIKTDAEITVEVNPESCSNEFLTQMKKAGVNRLSFGLQSDNNEILESIGRIHTYEDFLTAYNSAVNLGFDNLSVDLMIGLSSQNKDNIEKTLKNTTLLEKIKHISLYSLSLEEGTPLFEKGYYIDEEKSADIYQISHEFLEKAGFNRYEVSNFSKPNFESRHNLKYWQLDEYLGLGVAAHSYIDNERIENTSLLSKYNIGAFEEERVFIDLKTAIEEYIMLSLRTSQGLSYSVLIERYGYDLKKEKATQIANLEGLKVIKESNNGIKVEKNSFYVLNSIIMELI